MPMIITGGRGPDGRRRLEVYNPDADAETGRWCKAPLVPDRCYRCIDPETLAHYPAEGYREEVEPNGEIWRYGTCHRCCPPAVRDPTGKEERDAP